MCQCDFLHSECNLSRSYAEAFALHCEAMSAIYQKPCRYVIYMREGISDYTHMHTYLYVYCTIYVIIYAHIYGYISMNREQSGLSSLTNMAQRDFLFKFFCFVVFVFAIFIVIPCHFYYCYCAILSFRTAIIVNVVYVTLATLVIRSLFSSLGLSRKKNACK